jgi:GTPase
MPKPVIAIVGRPNVGKSTLFNRLLKRRIAIEDDQPGVTRDRLHADMEWNGVKFTLVDTGGLMTRAQEEIDALVSKAAEAAIETSDQIIFVVDGKLEVTDLDIEIARIVQKYKVPTLLAVTKIDRQIHEAYAYDFYALGLGEPMPVSGVSGLNTGDLLDKLVENYSTEEEVRDENEIRLAVLGRPNVGKSSLVNKLLGKEMQIVTNIPGTTRDAIDHKLKHDGREITLVDTAGLMKKSSIFRGEDVDYYTSLRTLRALDNCDVAAVLIDAVEGLTQYERRLIDEIRNKSKGLIIIFNKWDLIEKETMTMKKTEDEFHFQLPDLAFAPMLFTSALTGQRTRKLLDLALEVFDERSKRISTSVLNDFIIDVVNRIPPPAIKGKWLKIKYINQVKASPPVFILHLHNPELMPDSYKKYIERRLREEFGFKGVPLTVTFRKK